VLRSWAVTFRGISRGILWTPLLSWRVRLFRGGSVSAHFPARGLPFCSRGHSRRETIRVRPARGLFLAGAAAWGTRCSRRGCRHRYRVTQEFLFRRLLDTGPRSLRLVVLVDKPRDRRVDLKPDYFGFVVASKYLAGYGMAGSRGQFRNLPYIAARPVKGHRSAVRAGKTRQVR